jgi:hypothetical protein
MEYSCAMAVVELVPDEVPYNRGYSLLEFFTRAIPRAFWPGKIYPHYEAFTPIYEKGRLTAHVIQTSRRRILAGPAFTFIGHWYAVGGPVALILASFLTGCMLRAVLGIHLRNTSNEGSLILYGQFIMLGFAEVASTPLFFLFNLPFKLIPLLVVVHMARARRPLPARTPRPPHGRGVQPRASAVERGE